MTKTEGQIGKNQRTGKDLGPQKAAKSEDILLGEFNRLYSQDKYSDALECIAELVERNPEYHWYWSRLSSVCYEMRNYSDALQASEIAYKLEPDCPLVIWDYAVALEANNQLTAALEKYMSIISRGEDSIAYDDCGEGIGWARSVINDSKYMVAVISHELGDDKKAISYLEDHLQNRRKGQFSCYPIGDVKKLLNIWIEEARNREP